MSPILQIISVTAAVLCAYVLLMKIGAPWFLALLIAPVAGYVLWRWENADANAESGWSNALGTLLDLKDITKYVRQIF